MKFSPWKIVICIKNQLTRFVTPIVYGPFLYIQLSSVFVHLGLKNFKHPVTLIANFPVIGYWDVAYLLGTYQFLFIYLEPISFYLFTWNLSVFAYLLGTYQFLFIYG